jgi:hypothetical protein
MREGWLTEGNNTRPKGAGCKLILKKRFRDVPQNKFSEPSVGPLTSLSGISVDGIQRQVTEAWVAWHVPLLTFIPVPKAIMQGA